MDKLRILLVDDDKTFLEVMAPLIEVEGHKVKTASNGLEAVNLLEKESFDLVITDLKMPISDGLTLLESVKFRNPDIRVIIITAYATVDKTIKAWREGVYEFLTKPFTWADLKSIIQKVASEKKGD